jgi:FKBP-type peptidyl-prolyl cis-trans isomerase SlyD
MKMKIEIQRYVSMEYTLTLDSGEVIDKTEPGKPSTFICGAGQIIPGLEKALEGLEADQELKVTVEPEEAYGIPNPDFLKDIPREKFPSDINIEPGMQFEAPGHYGPMRFHVAAVEDQVVKADFNHPLAGERLHFDVHINEVREATEDELAEALTGSCGPCNGGTAGKGCC